MAIAAIVPSEDGDRALAVNLLMLLIAEQLEIFTSATRSRLTGTEESLIESMCDAEPILVATTTPGTGQFAPT